MIPRSPRSPDPAPGRARTAAVFLAGAALATLAFWAGRLGAPAERPGPATAAAPEPRPRWERQGAPGFPLPAAAWPAPPAAAEAAPVPQAPPLPTPAAAPRATPEITAAVAAEATARIDAMRGYIAERCWPKGGLRSGAKSARLRMNVTFDRDGKEIARGIIEDRRARMGEFTSCLRRLPGTRLAVGAPGTTVAVTLPLSFP